MSIWFKLMANAVQIGSVEITCTGWSKPIRDYKYEIITGENSEKVTGRVQHNPDSGALALVRAVLQDALP